MQVWLTTWLVGLAVYVAIVDPLYELFKVAAIFLRQLRRREVVVSSHESFSRLSRLLSQVVDGAPAAVTALCGTDRRVAAVK